MATMSTPATDQSHDAFPINGTDYIEFWVGNAKQSAIYYRAAFGFELTAYRGPETGVRDRASYLLTQGKIRFILTSAIRPEGPIAAHVAKLIADGSWTPRTDRLPYWREKVPHIVTPRG